MVLWEIECHLGWQPGMEEPGLVLVGLPAWFLAFWFWLGLSALPWEFHIFSIPHPDIS